MRIWGKITLISIIPSQLKGDRPMVATPVIETNSTAYRLFKNEAYLDMARRAYNYLTNVDCPLKII